MNENICRTTHISVHSSPPAPPSLQNTFFLQAGFFECTLHEIAWLCDEVVVKWCFCCIPAKTSTFSVRFMDEKTKCTNPFWAETKYFKPKDALYITLSGDPNPSNSIHLHVGMYSKTQHLPTSLKKGNLHFWKSLNNVQ